VGVKVMRGGGGHSLWHNGGGLDLYQWKHRYVVGPSSRQATPLPSSGPLPSGKALCLW